MRVMVTGHLGYIGSVLTPLLAGAGHTVVGLDSGLYRACPLYALPRVVASQNLRMRDIRDVEPKDLFGVEAIVHLAGLSNDPLGELDVTLTRNINHLATTRLAAMAKDAGVRRFVFASTCSVYGASGGDYVDESDALNPLTAYAKSKIAAEEDLMAMADAHFSPVALRCATAYGDSPMMRFDLVVNSLTAWAVSTARVRLRSDGMAWRPLVHVRDISRAFAACLMAPRAAIHKEIYNVGSTSENYRVRDIAQIVRAAVPGSWVTFARGAKGDSRCYRVNCDRLAEKVPEAAPRWYASRGVRQLVARFASTRISPEMFDGRKFSRVDHLRWLMETERLDQELRRSARFASPARRDESRVGMA